MRSAAVCFPQVTTQALLSKGPVAGTPWRVLWRAPRGRGDDGKIYFHNEVQPKNCALVLAARTLNAKSQSRVTQSLR